MGSAPKARPVVGVEHEFTVCVGTDPVDFRGVIHGLQAGRRNLDPDDLNAYRLLTGAVLTADKWEAEIALEPIPLAPGFGALATRRSREERDALVARLPSGTILEGYSTHLSIEVPDQLEVATGRLYVNRFGPAMLAAMDGPDAHGLRIRPRHRRLELCGDFIEGKALEDALEYAAGSVSACVAALRAPSETILPAEISADVNPAIERPGWFIDQHAIDRKAAGLTRTSVNQLDDSRRVAERALATWLSAVEDVDSWDGSPFGDVLMIRERRKLAMAPVMVTWPLTVFLVHSALAGWPAFAVVPREWLRAFLKLFDDGALDGVLRSYLSTRGRSSMAESWRDVRNPALFDQIPSRLALVPPEPM